MFVMLRKPNIDEVPVSVEQSDAAESGVQVVKGEVAQCVDRD